MALETLLFIPAILFKLLENCDINSDLSYIASKNSVHIFSVKININEPYNSF